MRRSLLWFCPGILFGTVLGVAALPGMAQVSAGPAPNPAPASGPAVPGPVPAAIARAKKVFVSNEGADGGLFPHPFSGTESRAYDQLYAALQQWGRYELVDDPSEADLVFDVQLLSPKGPQGADKVTGASDPLPEVRLAIYDRPTHYVLWAISEQVEMANLQKTHDRNFNEAMDALMADLKSLTGQTPAAP